MKEKRQGFSLMELVIVIAIMAILTSLMALSLGYLRTADAKGVAYGINSSLSDLKSRTMSKSGAVYMHLLEHEGSYYAVYTDSNAPVSVGAGAGVPGEELGSSTVTVVCDGTQLPAQKRRRFYRGAAEDRRDGAKRYRVHGISDSRHGAALCGIDKRR